MYFYIYDSFLVGKKYEKIISKIETRLASLDIAGKKYQLSVLKDVKEMVSDILKTESPTIVVIGSDKTFCQTALPMVGSNATLGFIPTDQDSVIANVLGLPVDEYASDVVSTRRIEHVTCGRINGQYFFSSLEFLANKSVLIADNKYEIIPKKIKTAKVVNLDLLRFKHLSNNDDFKRQVSNPRDDYLEILLGAPARKYWFLKTKEKLDSLFFVKNLKIKSRSEKEEVKIRVDHDKIVKTPVNVRLAKERLRIIVGKDRLI